MKPFTTQFWLKQLLTPQSLIAVILCIIALGLYVRGGRLGFQVRPEISLAQVPETSFETYTVELVSFDENQLERPIFSTLSSSGEPVERIKALINALKDELSFWPQGLELSTVYPLDDGLMVLDFSLEPNTILPSIQEEWRLLKSLQTSLKRNGFESTRILINHEESKVFLRFIKLDIVN